MAKRKRSERTKKTSRTSKPLRVDSSLLTTVIGEIFLPELNILSDYIRANTAEYQHQRRWGPR